MPSSFHHQSEPEKVNVAGIIKEALVGKGLNVEIYQKLEKVLSDTFPLLVSSREALTTISTLIRRDCWAGIDDHKKFVETAKLLVDSNVLPKLWDKIENVFNQTHPYSLSETTDCLRAIYKLVASLPSSFSDQYCKFICSLPTSPKDFLEVVQRSQHTVKILDRTNPELFNKSLEMISKLSSNGWEIPKSINLINRFLKSNPTAMAIDCCLIELDSPREMTLPVPILPKFFLNTKCSPTQAEFLQKIATLSENKSNLNQNLYLAIKIIIFSNNAPNPDQAINFIAHNIESNFLRGESIQKSLEYYAKFYRNLRERWNADHDLRTLISGPSHPEYELAKHSLYEGQLADAPPWPEVLSDESPNPALYVAQKDIFATLSRNRRVSEGFESITFACRSKEQGDPWLLSRYGADVGRETWRINCSDYNTFPGSGCLIKGFETSKIFRVDPDFIKEGEDPLLEYKLRWQFYQKELDLLSNANILFSRGMIAVWLDGKNKETEFYGEPYAAVWFNDHFHRHEPLSAILVPVRVLKNKLTQTLVPYDDFTSYNPCIKDIAKLNFTPEYFHTACPRSRLLNIGWSSNLGGLCNAFPPFSSPYHKWESKIKYGWGHFRDVDSHIHKAMIDGDYHPNFITPKTERMLKHLQKAHQEVYLASKTFNNLRDLISLGFSHWKKGLTEGRNQGEAGFPTLQKSGRISTFMLQEAYSWHHSLKSQGVENPNRYPLLVKSSSINPVEKDTGSFQIDTFDLVFRDNSGLKVPLEAERIGNIEYALWLKKVIPEIQDDSSGLDFIHRKLLK